MIQKFSVQHTADFAIGIQRRIVPDDLALLITDQNRHIGILRKAECDRTEYGISDIGKIAFRHTIADQGNHRNKKQNEQITRQRAKYDRCMRNRCAKHQYCGDSQYNHRQRR